MARWSSLARNGPADIPYETIVVLNNPKRDDESRLRVRIIALAHEYGRYGYRRITALLQQEGGVRITSGWSGSGGRRG